VDDNVLLVDDNEEILNSYRRYFYRSIPVDTESNPLEALVRLKKTNYKVVLSDLKMPQLDGIQFLSKAKEISPDTTRIMITGYADVNVAITAVNEGQVFRFLTKPSPPELIEKAIKAGIEFYDLRTAERVLLEQTLNGSISTLVEILSIVNPTAFSRTARIKKLVHTIVQAQGITPTWQFELAAMLSQIGYVTIPSNLLEKINRNEVLTDHEKAIIANHPQTAKKLLEKIPRLETIIPMICNQSKPYDSYPEGSENGPMGVTNYGSQLLKVVIDYDTLAETGQEPGDILSVMITRSGFYNPRILRVLVDVTPSLPSMDRREVRVSELEYGMIIDDDIKTHEGLLLLRRGQEITETVLTRLHNISNYSKIREPFIVLIPRKAS
jgi:response regulator RpfG family c-di-GMP phosphodiesterase